MVSHALWVLDGGQALNKASLKVVRAKWEDDTESRRQRSIQLRLM